MNKFLIQTILLIIFILFILFPKFFLGSDFLIPSDLLTKYSPWNSLNEQVEVKNTLRSDVLDTLIPRLEQFSYSIKNNEYPLWNPYQSQGRPLGTTVFESHFHPLIGIPFALFDTPYAFSISILLRIVTMFFSSFLYFKYGLRLKDEPSLLGSIIFSFFGFNNVWLSWPHAVVASSAPLMFLGIELLFKSNRLSSGLFISLSILLMLLGGFPAVAGYYLYFSCIYFIYFLINLKISNKEKSTMFVKFSILVLLGITSSFVQILPTLEYLNFIDISYRITENPVHFPISSILQLFNPYIFGSNVFNSWSGHSNFNETTGYTGIISIIAITFLLPTTIHRYIKNVKDIHALHTIFFIISTFTIIAIIYGIGSLHNLISILPVFNSSMNTRLFSIFSLTMASLTALFANNLLLVSNRSRTFYIYTTITLSLFSFFALISSFIYLYIKYINGNLALNNLFPHIFTIVYLIASILILLTIFIYLRYKSKKLMTILIFTVVIFDLLIFSFNQNPTTGKRYFYPITDGTLFLKNNLTDEYRMASFNGLFMIPGAQLFYNINSNFSHTFYNEQHKEIINSFSEESFITPTLLQPKIEDTQINSHIFKILGTRYFALPSEHRIDAGLNQLVTNSNLGPINITSDEILQSFKIFSPTDESSILIKDICLKFGTYNRSNQGRGIIRLLDKDQSQIISADFDLNILEDNHWMCIVQEGLIEKNIFLDNQETYFVTFKSMGSVNDSVTIWSATNNPYKEGQFNKDDMIDINFKIIFGDSDYSLVYSGKDMNIYQNKDESIGSYLANNTLKFSNSKDAIDYLSNNDVIGSNSVILEDDVPIDQLTHCSLLEVSILEYKFNSIKYLTNSDCTAILSTPELWYPGWKAKVNGKSEEVIKTNLIFRGVKIPPGKSHVVFQYSPMSFYIGGIISLLSISIIISISFFNIYRQNNSDIKS